MRRGWTIAAFLVTTAAYGQVKTKLYVDPEGCIKSYSLAPGRVLTSRGLIEDPTVNAIMKDAVSAQMSGMKIAEADKDADVEIRFMGVVAQVFRWTILPWVMWRCGTSEDRRPCPGGHTKRAAWL